MKDKKTIKNLKQVLGGFLLVTGLLNLWGCGARDDVSFARQVMAGLVAGRYSVRAMIDWPNFKALDKDVGAEYSRLLNAQEKTSYERAFIDNFKKGFQQNKATINSFNNWRLFSNSDPVRKIVAAGCVDRTNVLLFGINHTNKGMKFTQITALKVVDEAKFREVERGFVHAAS